MNTPKRIAHLAVLVVSIFTACAYAQIFTDPTKAANDGVYVRDSAVVTEKLALADKLEHLQEWAKSADVYQELLQKFADRVAPLGKDQTDQVDQYTSVANIVQEKLAHWPADGLAAYRGRYEPEAAALLQQAGNDPAALHGIIDRYFITDSAKIAALRLIDGDMESGDFTAAAWVGDRMLKLYPGIDADRPMLLYRTAIGYRLAGDNSASQAHADELIKNFATAQGAVQGRQIVLADSLQGILKSAQPTTENVAPDSWPMAFGSPDRARIPNVSGFGGAKLFNIALSKDVMQSPDRNAAPQRQQILRQLVQDRELGLLSGVMPVIDRGELFFQDNVRIYAVNLDSGLPLAGWANNDEMRDGRYSVTAWPLPRNMMEAVAITDDSVLAIMGQMDLTSMIAGFNFSQRDTKLVCLDRRTGKQKWDKRPQDLPVAALHDLQLVGSPLVVGDNVYITAHGSPGVQFQDCHLICLDLAGNFKWSSYVASASAGTAIFDGDPNDQAENIPQLAYSGGRVFVLSNLGALAAIDAYDGNVAWLNLYPRENSTPGRGFAIRFNRAPNQQGAQRPWTTSPVIVSQGRVFVLPTDGRYLMIYDAASGLEVNRIKLAHIQNAATMLAVVNDRLILCGPGEDMQNEQTHVLCLNWQNYKLADYNDSKSSMLLWRQTYPQGLRGRGFVTTDAVYLPTQKKLFRINLKNGRAEAQYPDGERSWDSTESSGNILVTQDHLIVAGPQWVNVYTDLNLAMAKLDKDVAAAADDPNARLRYAEVMFVAGKVDVAVAKLDEAIKVLGGLQNAGASPARDRIFTNALTFAEKSQPPAADPPRANANEDVATINGLYDRAGAAANDPSQQVNYRISRADFALRQHDLSTELKLLQEILSEPTWRVVPVPRKSLTTPTQAAAVATSLIADIKKDSPETYGPVEAEAQKVFTDAVTSADPVKLLAVSQTYPNSDVAPQAMLKAADAYEAVGNPRQAVQILRQHYLAFPTASDATTVLESLARNYLATPNHVDVALARLMQAAKRSPDAKLSKPIALPNGTVVKDVSFTQAADALRQYIEQGAARPLPDFGIPLQRDDQATKPFVRDADPIALHISAMISPIKDFSRNDRLATFSTDNTLSVFTVGKADPLFTSHLFKDRPNNCAWIGDNLLIISPSTIALLKPDGSAALWQTELKSIPVVEVATHDDSDTDNPDRANNPMNGPAQVKVNGGRVVILQGGQRIILHGGGGRFRIGNPQLNNVQQVVPAGAEQIMKVSLLADRALLTTSGGRIICLDLTDGKTLWQVRPSDRPTDRLLATDDFVVAQITEGTATRVLAFDTFSGQSIGHREFSNENGGLINLALSPDGKLIYLLPDQLECYDLFEPADRPAYQVQVKGADANNGAFSGAFGSDQLLIAQSRIVVLSDEGRFIRIYSLADGKVLHGNGADGIDMTHGLQTHSSDWQVSLAAAGSRLYALGLKSVVEYNLNDFTDSYAEEDPRDTTRAGYIIGKDYLLVMGQVVAPNNRRVLDRAATTSIRIAAFSRAVLPNGHESGYGAYEYPVNSPAGVTDFQATDGGLFYLCGDHKLYFLKGARK